MTPKLHVLVTGGAGYIGSHTCKRLAQAGFVPVVYDNLSTGHRDAVRWGPLVEGDILDGDRVGRVLADYRPVAVMHFAAAAYVGESVENPAKYYRNNVAGSLSLIDACRRRHVAAIIHSSSCATYGVPTRLPVDETIPQQPISPYGRTKLTVERMLADFGDAYGLRHVNLRYFNAGGADPDGQLAERHSPETHLIPCTLLSACGHRPHVVIYGDDYDTADGTCLRDYVHVNDLAEAHLAALQHLLDGGDSLSLNLGSEQATSNLQVVKAVERVTGRSVPIVFKPRRAGDPPALLADTAKARACFGFAPRLSDIDAIVRTAAPSFGLNA